MIASTCRPSTAGSKPINRTTDGNQHPRQARDCASPKACSPGGDPDTATAQEPRGTQPVFADRGLAPDRTASVPTTPIPPALLDPALALAADILDDTEGVWIANSNRLRVLTRTEPDEDGEMRGFGLDETHPDVARLAAMVDALERLVKDATRNLEKIMRRHPLYPWVKAQKGLGDKQTARLLAAVGDPYWNTLYERPRTVSELWAYCGFHVLPAGHGLRDDQSVIASRDQAGEADPGQLFRATHELLAGVAPRRQRGQRSNWSDTARKRAWLVATSIIKAGGPYRVVYDDARSKYADAVHRVPCIRCGPAGKPAQAGSPLSLGHQHARGLRAVAKAVLKDLWREAARLHQGETCD